MPFLELGGALLKSASDNSNRRRQFDQGNIRNTFSIFTGGPRANLAPLLANNSVNTLLQGAAAAKTSVGQKAQQSAQDRIQQALLQRLTGGQASETGALSASDIAGFAGLLPQQEQLTLNAPRSQRGFSQFGPGAALA